MSDDRKPPLLVPFPGSNKRAGTVHGDRNDDRKVVPTPPRGVGLTEPPENFEIVAVRATGVPRGEFNFESKTPIGTEPELWRALREFRKKAQETDESIIEDVQELREGHIEIKTKLNTLLEITTKNDEAAEKRRKYIAPVITAVGIALAGIIAAIVHGCS